MPAVSEDEIQTFYETNKDTTGDRLRDKVHDQIRDYLREQKNAAQKNELFKSLRAKAKDHELSEAAAGISSGGAV